MSSRITDRQVALIEQWEAEIAQMRARGQRSTIVKIRGRKPRADSVRTRVFPGVTGRLVQWGDGTDLMPTLAEIRVDDLARYIGRCRAEIGTQGDES